MSVCVYVFVCVYRVCVFLFSAHSVCSKEGLCLVIVPIV